MPRRRINNVFKAHINTTSNEQAFFSFNFFNRWIHLWNFFIALRNIEDNPKKLISLKTLLPINQFTRININLLFSISFEFHLHFINECHFVLDFTS